MEVFEINWKQLFVPDTPLFETFIRGTVSYFVIFFLMRILPNRKVVVIGMNDLLLVVLVASASTSALAGDYKSITGGLILVATLIFWSYAFNFLGHRVPSLHWLFHSSPKPLIKDGEIQEENMHKELISEEQLLGKLRRQGATEIAQVKEAHVESDGSISVIKHDSK